MSESIDASKSTTPEGAVKQEMSEVTVSSSSPVEEKKPKRTLCIIL